MCLFKFERPQRLKVVVHSRNKFGGRSMPEDSLLGAPRTSGVRLVDACMHAQGMQHGRSACNSAAVSPTSAAETACQA
jgi:hypothetical protein